MAAVPREPAAVGDVEEVHFLVQHRAEYGGGLVERAGHRGGPAPLRADDEEAGQDPGAAGGHARRHPGLPGPLLERRGERLGLAPVTPPAALRARLRGRPAPAWRGRPPVRGLLARIRPGGDRRLVGPAHDGTGPCAPTLPGPTLFIGDLPSRLSCRAGTCRSANSMADADTRCRKCRLSGI